MAEVNKESSARDALMSPMANQFAPLSRIHLHIDGFHFYNGDMHRQLEAHHYCSPVNSEVHQCVVYDSDKENARIIGVEYIISERLFKELPEEEKRYWHSHQYEVKSGLLTIDNLSEEDEYKWCQSLMSTYGKTYHFWQVDRGDLLPLGPPQLMMAFTQDNQVDPKLIDERDKRCGISASQKRRAREPIEFREKPKGVDHWEGGKELWQLDIKNKLAKAKEGKETSTSA